MQIQRQLLFQKLEKLAEHYNGHIATQYLKAEFPSLTLSARDWDEIELITVRQDLYRYQGYHLDDLYLKLLSLARLVKAARTQFGPNIKNRIAKRFAQRPHQERVMAEMTATNFLPNLQILADIVLDLYDFAKKEDADQNQGKTRVLSSVPEVRDIEALLQA